MRYMRIKILKRVFLFQMEPFCGKMNSAARKERCVMKSLEMYQKLARLIVRRGLNVQKGQPVVIKIDVRHHDFADMLVKEAYEAGAKTVEIDWKDPFLTTCRTLYEDEETLCDVPQWMYDQIRTRQDNGVCSVSVLSTSPDCFKDADHAKMAKMNIAVSKKTKDLSSYFMNNIGQWCVVGIPDVQWAKSLFPELSEEEAFEKLENAIFEVSRVDEKHDPVETWEKHDATLVENAKKMNAYAFDSLHFTSELGTDITVGLVKNHIWAGGNGTTPAGVVFDPNIPTEEIFCMPDNTRINGIVYASKPLLFAGQRIEDFWLKFENGRVVDFDAKKGLDSLTALLNTDEGSRSLGEVALVPFDSPVSHTGILFCNTLYDENAACHLALGACYPENIAGGADMSEEELAGYHGNDSAVHEDFMFGTRELSADGLTTDGQVIPVFRHGNFVW